MPAYTAAPMFLTLFCIAGAHVPHPTVLGWAAPSMLDDRGPWWLLTSSHAPMLLRSDDGGWSFESIGGEPIGDRPVGIAQVEDGTLALLGESRLWVSSDGVLWNAVELPGEVHAIRSEGNAFLLGGADGIWRVSSTGTAQREWPAPIGGLHAGERVTATTEAGEVLVSTGGGWQLLSTPGARPLAALSAGEVVYAGFADGRVQQLRDRDWLECGPIAGAGQAHTSVVAFAADGDLLAVATGLGTVFTSTDGCASFVEYGTPNDVSYGAIGDPQTDTQAVTVLGLSGPTVVAGGWNGLGASWAAGTWRIPQLMVGDYFRGVALARGGDQAAVLYTGAQSAGPARSVDGGLTYTAVNHGLLKPNVQGVAVDPADPAIAYAIVNHEPFRTDDGGDHWREVGEVASGSPLMHAGPAECEVWGYLQGRGQRSVDCGRNWTDLIAGGGEPLAYRSHQGVVVDGGTRWCIAVGGEVSVWCADVPGGPYAQVWANPDSSELILAAGSAAPSRLVLATGNGIVVSDDAFATATEVLLLERDQVLSIHMSDDGSAVAGTLAGLLYASADSGDTWSLVPGRLSAPAWDISSLADGDGQGFFVVGTLDGVHLVTRTTAGAWEVSRMPRWQRIDDSSGYWQREGVDVDKESDEAAMDSRTLLVPAGTMTTMFRGSSLTVLGTADGASVGNVWIDGALVGSIGEHVSNGVLYTTPLADGWHELTLAGVAGEGIFVDAIEATGAGGLLPSGGEAEREVPTHVDDSDEACGGCTTAGRALAPLGWVLAAALSRRARAPRQPRTG